MAIPAPLVTSPPSVTAVAAAGVDANAAVVAPGMPPLDARAVLARGDATWELTVLVVLMKAALILAVGVGVAEVAAPPEGQQVRAIRVEAALPEVVAGVAGAGTRGGAAMDVGSMEMLCRGGDNVNGTILPLVLFLRSGDSLFSG